jgi:ABC-2 type transport system permease protein
VVNTGTLQRLTGSHIRGFDIKAFMLPTSVLLGVTGVSRAGALVLDIQNGYFDRLLLTPVRRLAILVGHMLADVAIACMLIVPILVLAVGVGVRLETGVIGAMVFVLEGLRSLVTQGWQWDSLAKAVLAIAAVGVVSMSLCLAALRGRTRHG